MQGFQCRLLKKQRNSVQVILFHSKINKILINLETISSISTTSTILTIDKIDLDMDKVIKMSNIVATTTISNNFKVSHGRTISSTIGLVIITKTSSIITIINSKTSSNKATLKLGHSTHRKTRSQIASIHDR